MFGPQRKKQFFIYAVVTALLASGLWLVRHYEAALGAFFGARIGAGATPDTGVNLIKMGLLIGLALVWVRVLSILVFGALKRVSGYYAPALVRNIFSIVACVLAFVVIFKWFYPNIELTPLLATSTIFGLILGLALQDTLGNLFSGISLQADKPFQVGDVVTVGTQTGIVESVTWRGVRLRTFTNRVVLMSNSAIAKESIEVAPRGNLNARIVFFNTLYTNSPAKTIHVVREAIREAENISRARRPVVRIKSLAADGIDWEVKYWLEDYAKYNDTDALVRQLIWYAFRRAGIEFAFPTRTVFIERAKRETSHSQRHSRFVERLAAVDLFAPLSDAETERLASAAQNHIFASGEYLIRAGEPGSSMFVVNKGRVKVQIQDNGKPRTVATLGEGDFFGEMALFTGEPRTANVVASEETEVMEICHEPLKQIFDTNPDLLESFSEIIAERRAGLTTGTEDAEAMQKQTAGVLKSIRRFFGFD